MKNAQEKGRTAFSNVKVSAQAVQEAKSAELETAYNNLETAIRNVPDTATLQQASQAISPQVAEVERAEAQMEAGLNCP